MHTFVCDCVLGLQSSHIAVCVLGVAAGSLMAAEQFVCVCVENGWLLIQAVAQPAVPSYHALLADSAGRMTRE